LGIENLDYFILILQNYDVYFECIGGEIQNMQDFLSSYEALLEEHKKLIMEKELFEDDYDDIKKLPKELFEDD